jgi:hypothetical protein
MVSYTAGEGVATMKRINKNKLNAFLIGVCGLIGALTLIAWGRTPKPESVEQFGTFKVGSRVRSPSSYKFYVCVIDEQLPPLCEGLVCGRQARAVTGRGGHLGGGSDYKWVKEHGIKIVKTSSLTRRVLYHVPPLVDRLIGRRIRRDFWTFETSLVVVVNCEGRIVRIYKNAGIKDVPRLVSNLEDSELCPP